MVALVRDHGDLVNLVPVQMTGTARHHDVSLSFVDFIFLTGPPTPLEPSE
jgi:hypothetical protein